MPKKIGKFKRWVKNASNGIKKGAWYNMELMRWLEARHYTVNQREKFLFSDANAFVKWSKGVWITDPNEIQRYATRLLTADKKQRNSLLEGTPYATKQPDYERKRKRLQ